MKKNIYLTLIALFATTVINAQITITAPPLSAANYNDSFGEPSNKSDFKVFATAKTNAKWDFTIAQYPNKGYHSLRTTNTSSNYPNADYNQLASYIFAGNLGYEVLNNFTITSASINRIGEEIIKEKVISLASVTGGANDELVFPVQNIKYSSPIIITKFPLTYGGTFSSSISSETKFDLTVMAYGLNNTPGTRKTYRVVSDSVIGWGTADIKGAFYGKTYKNVPVLQVRHIVTATDSFYLGGNPAPQQLLDAFGLKQGVPMSAYSINFYKQGELDELIHIDFGETPFQTVEEVEIQENRLEQYTTGLNKLSLQNAVNTYPNPITGNTIYIDLPNNNSGEWTYSLKDIFGRKISDGAIKTNEISLPVSLEKGNYILTISNSNEVVSINKLIK